MESVPCFNHLQSHCPARNESSTAINWTQVKSSIEIHDTRCPVQKFPRGTQIQVQCLRKFTLAKVDKRMDLWWPDPITHQPTVPHEPDEYWCVPLDQLSSSASQTLWPCSATHSQIGGKKTGTPMMTWASAMRNLGTKQKCFFKHTLLVSLMTCQVDIVFIWNTAAHRNFHSVTWHGPIHLDHLEILQSHLSSVLQTTGFKSGRLLTLKISDSFCSPALYPLLLPFHPWPCF